MKVVVLFFQVASDTTRANGLRLHQERFRLDIGKNLFPERAVGCWNKLPSAVWSPHPWRDLRDA